MEALGIDVHEHGRVCAHADASWVAAAGHAEHDRALSRALRKIGLGLTSRALELFGAMRTEEGIVPNVIVRSSAQSSDL